MSTSTQNNKGLHRPKSKGQPLYRVPRPPCGKLLLHLCYPVGAVLVLFHAFSYSGEYFHRFIFNRTLDQFQRVRSVSAMFQSVDSYFNMVTLIICMQVEDNNDSMALIHTDN